MLTRCNRFQFNLRGATRYTSAALAVVVLGISQHSIHVSDLGLFCVSLRADKFNMA